MSVFSHQVIVVGGGPAGSSVAAHLVRAGFGVLLLDRATFPRDKPCGEFFSPPVRGLLTRLGVYEEVLRAGVRDIPQAVLHGADTRAAGNFTGHSHPCSEAGGFSLERRVLDDILWRFARKSGVDCRSGVSVRGLLRDNNGITRGVRTDCGDFTAPLIIGADGATSRVARELGVIRSVARLQKIALVSHFREVGRDAPGAVEMFVAPGGFVCGYGSGPDGTANVTLVVPTSEAHRLSTSGAEAYADSLLSHLFPEVLRRVCRGVRERIVTCGTHGHTTRSAVADGALLVGDAACFIDPFTGEGVYFALRGAELAAEAAAYALRCGDTSTRGLAPYARLRRREFASKYRVCDLVERVVHQPGLLGWAVAKLARNPRLLERILAVTGDMAPPISLLSPASLGELAGATRRSRSS